VYSEGCESYLDTSAKGRLSSNQCCLSIVENMFASAEEEKEKEERKGGHHRFCFLASAH
jgi:hypothetical protein